MSAVFLNTSFRLRGSALPVKMPFEKVLSKCSLPFGVFSTYSKARLINCSMFFIPCSRKTLSFAVRAKPMVENIFRAIDPH